MVIFKFFSKISPIGYVSTGSKKLNSSLNHHWSQLKFGHFQIFGVIAFSGNIKEKRKILSKNFADPVSQLCTNPHSRSLNRCFSTSIFIKFSIGIRLANYKELRRNRYKSSEFRTRNYQNN